MATDTPSRSSLPELHELEFAIMEQVWQLGRASVHEDDPLLAELPGAQLIVRVQVEAAFPNCPRYIHRMQVVEESPYAPCEGHTPPVPEWKTRPVFREVLPPTDPAHGSAR